MGAYAFFESVNPVIGLNSGVVGISPLGPSIS
jgi:hypothetical protein